ncbi:MAG: hypothetical protein NC254_10695, partial [bacterium]|nr:hypothetical protein [bacterium]
RDQILFPVLQNRTVLVDDSANFYILFFRTFAGSTDDFSLAPDERSVLISMCDTLSFSTSLRLINLMNYAFPGYQELTNIPTLYLDEAALSGEYTLIAVSDNHQNLYLFTQKTYREVTAHHE